MVHRLLHMLGYMLAPVLFLKAGSPESIARRLVLAYRLVGVKVVEVRGTDLKEKLVILCPYRNLLASKYGKKGFCHNVLDYVDEGYATYLKRHRGVVYLRPRSCDGENREYCCSEVWKEQSKP